MSLLKERGEHINELRQSLDIQFKRIAQMQAELDVIRKAWEESGGARRVR